MFFRGHDALADIDKRLRQARFITGRGLQEDILVQIQQLLLGVHQAIARIQRDDRLVFHQKLGAQCLEIEVIPIGDILRRGFRP